MQVQKAIYISPYDLSIRANDFLITATRQNHIDQFLETIKMKYEVCDLGYSAIYSGWTSMLLNYRTIRTAQTTLIHEFLSKHNMAKTMLRYLAAS